MSSLDLDQTGPFTVDDIPDEGHYELVDGVLVMVPMPTPRHEVAAQRLAIQLERAAGRERVFTVFRLTFSRVNYREPDIGVIREGLDLWNAPAITPGMTLLVCEVVSPSSVRNDHVSKRAKYAEAGIPHYWIVETEPELRLTALALPEAGGVYVEAGSWVEGETVSLSQPFPIGFAVSELRG